MRYAIHTTHVRPRIVSHAIDINYSSYFYNSYNCSTYCLSCNLLIPPSKARRGYTKSELVLVSHCKVHMIIKYQLMIESNHKIRTLSRGPQQKVRGAKLSTRMRFFFYATKKNKIIFQTDAFLQNVWSDF